MGISPGAFEHSLLEGRPKFLDAGSRFRIANIRLDYWFCNLLADVLSACPYHATERLGLVKKWQHFGLQRVHPPHSKIENGDGDDQRDKTE